MDNRTKKEARVDSHEARTAYEDRLRDSFVEHRHLCLLGIVALGLVLRLAFLSCKSLWLDEIFSVGLSQIPWRPFWQLLGSKEPNMAAYYLILRLWSHLGTSEWTIRLLSVALGVLTLPVVYGLATHLFGKPVGVISSLLLATNAFHIQWSQEARGYSLVVLLVSCSSLFFVRSIEFSSPRTWCGYVISSVLAIYSHIFAVLVLASHLLSLLFYRRKPLPWRSLLVSFAAIALLASPSAIALYLRSREPLPHWIPNTKVHDVYDAFYSLAGNASFAGSSGGQLLLLAYFLLSAGVVWSIARNIRNKQTSWREMLLVCWLVVPIASVFAVSMIQPFYVNRYLLICVPPLVISVARGVAVLRFRWSTTWCLLSVVTLALLRLPGYYTYREHAQDWRNATEYVIANARTNDAVVFWIAPGRLLFEYYMEHSNSKLRPVLNVVYPTPDPKDYGDQLFLTHHPPLDESVLHSLAATHDRIWVVLYFDGWQFARQTTELLEESLSMSHDSSYRVQLGDIKVILYKKEGLAGMPIPAAAASSCNKPLVKSFGRQKEAATHNITKSVSHTHEAERHHANL